VHAGTTRMGYATLYARRPGYASRYVYPYWTYPIRSGDRYHGTGRSGGRSSEVPSTILGYARRIVPGLQGRGCPSKTNAIVDRGRSWVREMRPRVGPCSVHAPPLSSSRRPPHLSSATAPPRSCGGKGSWVYADGAPHNPSTPCRYFRRRVVWCADRLCAVADARCVGDRGSQRTTKQCGSVACVSAARTAVRAATASSTR
jgi:hypothetical protein